VDQHTFDFPPDKDEPRRKRYRRRKPLPPPKDAAPEAALIQTPVLQRCGFCGSNETVMAETHVCVNCGGILLRCEEPE
jgi:hypothetical protein